MNGDHQHLEELELIELALDGLEGRQREAAEAHLQVCPHCRAMLSEAMLLQDGFASLTEEAPAPLGLADSILAKVRNAGH
jgi:predicted anti-sigma-YlaC factor YlaD